MKQSELLKYEQIREKTGKGYGGFNHAKRHYPYLTQLFKAKEPLRIADVGCGDGKFPLWIKENFPQHEVFGIDPVFIDEGTESGVFFKKGDTTKIPVQAVDILTSFDVMEHICEEDLEASFVEIRRATKRMFVAQICTRKSKSRGVNGEDLHPTCRPLSWWKGQFERHFSKVELRSDRLLVCRV